MALSHLKHSDNVKISGVMIQRARMPFGGFLHRGGAITGGGMNDQWSCQAALCSIHFLNRATSRGACFFPDLAGDFFSSFSCEEMHFQS
jgi:hypothetical protein